MSNNTAPGDPPPLHPAPDVVSEAAPARDRKGVIPFMARNGVAANLLMIFLLLAGIYAYGEIVQEVFPESSLDTVQVSVDYPGATPDEIEQSIISSVEEAVEAVEGVSTIKSTASEGRGVVNVELESGSNIPRALDDIKSEVGRIQTFPAEANEPDISELTNRQVVLRIALFGDLAERSLKQTAIDLEDRISALPEVSYVQTSSVRDYRIYIDVPQEKLQALNLSLPDVSNIIAANSLDSSAGSLTTTTDEVRVRTVGQGFSQRDYEDIILVTTGEGDILRLGEVASVEDGFEDSELIARFNDRPVVFVDVYRTSDERVLDVAEAVKELLETSYSPPPGVEYAVWDDNSQLLNDRLSLLLRNAAVGLLLVLIALSLFLDLRLAFWSAVGIGVVFVGAIFVLDAVGSSINMFSLFGFILALGLVVDDAVVVGENIFAEREKGRTGLGASIAGAQRVRTPVIFAVLTSITSILPLLAIGGTIGKLVADIPLVVVAVLVLSLIEALLILPNHLSHLPAPGAVSKNRVLRWFEKVQARVDRYFTTFIDGPLDKALRFSTAFPAIVISAGVTLLIVFAALLPAGIIKFSFFPQIEGEAVTANIELPAGTTIERTEQIANRVEQAGDAALARFVPPGENAGAPGFVDAIYTTVGARTTGGGTSGQGQQLSSNIASIQIALVSANERDVGAAEIEEAWREELGDVPEARSFSISSDQVSFGAPINIQIFHPDGAELVSARERVMEELGQIDGVFNIESDQDAGQREIELRLKPSARTLGVSVQDLASQVRAAFFGAEAERIQRGGEDVRVYVRLPEDERNSIGDVEQFNIRTPGGFVPLGALAQATFTEAPATIQREDGRRQVTITAEVDEEVITGQRAANFIATETMPPISVDYPALQYRFGGQQQEQAEVFADLGIAFGIALIVIYALLAIPFRSYSQPLVIMAAIPFGLIGALFAHLLLGLSLGILSLLGFVALAGVIINGSLVMIDFFNEQVDDGVEPTEAIIIAAKSRFRPIMLTTITTFLGVAPITFETSIQAQFLIPMAASLGFGVLIGTLLLMLVIPALTIVHVKALAFFNRSMEPQAEEMT